MDAPCSTGMRHINRSPRCKFLGQSICHRWATNEQPICSTAKQIDVQIQFVRGLVRDGEISAKYVKSEENDADLLTKPFAKCVLHDAMEKIGLHKQPREQC